MLWLKGPAKPPEPGSARFSNLKRRHLNAEAFRSREVSLPDRNDAAKNHLENVQESSRKNSCWWHPSPCPSALKPSCVACGRYTSIPDYLFPAADMNPVWESIACNQGVSSLERGEAVLLSRVPLCRCILCVFPLSVAWNLVPGKKCYRNTGFKWFRIKPTRKKSEGHVWTSEQMFITISCRQQGDTRHREHHWLTNTVTLLLSGLHLFISQAFIHTWK